MPTLKIPQPLRSYTQGETYLILEGITVAEMLQSLGKQYPELNHHLYTKKGDLAAFIHIFVNEDDIRNLDGIQTRVKTDDQVVIVPSIAGGCE